MIIAAVIVVLVLILVLTNVQVVQQSKAYVIERLGAYPDCLGRSAFMCKMPFIDRVVQAGHA